MRSQQVTIQQENEPVALSSDPIEVAFVQHRFYVLNGHHRLSAALFCGKRWIAGDVVAQEADTVLGARALDVAEASMSPSRIYDWEDAHKFLFSWNR